MKRNILSNTFQHITPHLGSFWIIHRSMSWPKLLRYHRCVFYLWDVKDRKVTWITNPLKRHTFVQVSAQLARRVKMDFLSFYLEWICRITSDYCKKQCLRTEQQYNCFYKNDRKMILLANTWWVDTVLNILHVLSCLIFSSTCWYRYCSTILWRRKLSLED